MSAVAAAEAAVLRRRLLAGEQITLLVGAALGPGGTLNMANASLIALTRKYDARIRQSIIAELDETIAAHSEPQPQPPAGDV